jgi:hypothetical protein
MPEAFRSLVKSVMSVCSSAKPGREIISLYDHSQFPQFNLKSYYFMIEQKITILLFALFKLHWMKGHVSSVRTDEVAECRTNISQGKNVLLVKK